MSLRTFIPLNLVFAAMIIAALVSVPHLDFDTFPRFLFVALGSFVGFGGLAFLAKMRFASAVWSAVLWSFTTLLFALLLQLFVHGFGPCAMTDGLRLC